MRRLLLVPLVFVVGVLIVGTGAPKEIDVSLSAITEERQMGFDSSCQHLKFVAMDRIVFPGQPPPVSHLHDHYGTLAGPDATLSDAPIHQ